MDTTEVLHILGQQGGVVRSFNGAYSAPRLKPTASCLLFEHSQRCVETHRKDYCQLHIRVYLTSLAQDAIIYFLSYANARMSKLHLQYILREPHASVNGSQ